MDNIQEISFQIIADAGDAKSKAMQAMRLAIAEDFEQAQVLLSQAKESIKSAHKTQTNLMQKEAMGETIPFDIVLVHSQDHFSMATTAIDMAEIVIAMSKKAAK